MLASRSLLKSRVTFFLTALILILLTNSTAHAQLQRMVLMMGKYVVGGKGRLPAYCMDVERDPPKIRDRFNSISGKVNFQKTDSAGRPVGKPLSYDEAISELGAQITGTVDGSIRELNFEFKRLGEGEKVEIEVQEFAVASADREDGKQGMQIVKEIASPLQMHRQNIERLRSTLGPDGGLVRHLADNTSDLLWGLRAGRQATSTDMITELRELAEAGECKTVAKALAVLNEKIIEPTQLDAINETLGLGLSEKDLELSPSFRGQFERFQHAAALVRDFFGESSDQARTFGSAAVYELLAGSRLTGTVESLIDQYFGSIPESKSYLAQGLIALKLGKKPTKDQVEKLGKLLRRDFNGDTTELADCVLLEDLGDGRARINTIDQSREMDISRLNPNAFRTPSGKRPRFFTNGVISEDLADKLNKQKIYFVRDASWLTSDAVGNNEKPFQLIVIADPEPKDGEAVNRELFELEPGENIGTLNKAVRTLVKTDALFAQDQTSLIKAMDAAVANGRRPMVFFHNGQGMGQILFRDGEYMSLAEFNALFGPYGALPLTCSSFGESGIGARTTTDMYAEHVANAYKEMTAETASSQPPRAGRGGRQGWGGDDESFNRFGEAYGKSKGKKEKFLVRASISPLLLGLGVALIEIFTADDDEENGDEENNKSDSSDKDRTQLKDLSSQGP